MLFAGLPFRALGGSLELFNSWKGRWRTIARRVGCFTAAFGRTVVARVPKKLELHGHGPISFFCVFAHEKEREQQPKPEFSCPPAPDPQKKHWSPRPNE